VSKGGGGGGAWGEGWGGGRGGGGGGGGGGVGGQPRQIICKVAGHKPKVNCGSEADI